MYCTKNFFPSVCADFILNFVFIFIFCYTLSFSQPLSFTRTFRQAISQGGVRVLYAGLPVTLMRAVPMNAAVLFTYEAVMGLTVV